MKKLICLCVVLALAGSAWAGTAIWSSTAPGTWEATSNWGGSGPPGTGNDTYAFRATGTAAANPSVIEVTSTGAGALALFLGQPSSTKPSGVTSTNTATTLTIDSGAALKNTKVFSQWSYQSGSSSTVDIYGTVNACTGSSAGLTWDVASSSTAVSNDKVIVRTGGVMNVGTTGTGTQSGTLNIAATGSGTGTVTIYGGTANVRTGYAIGTNGKLYFAGTGIMWVAGNITGTVAADILAGKIAFTGDAIGVNYGYDASHAVGGATGATWVQGVVPEPATVALLGLGSLLLSRKKR